MHHTHVLVWEGQQRHEMSRRSLRQNDYDDGRRKVTRITQENGLSLGVKSPLNVVGRPQYKTVNIQYASCGDRLSHQQRARSSDQSIFLLQQHALYPMDISLRVRQARNHPGDVSINYEKSVKPGAGIKKRRAG